MRRLIFAILMVFSLLPGLLLPPASLQGQGTSSEEDETKGRSKVLFKRFDETANSLDIVTAESGEKFAWTEAPLFRFSSEGTVFGSVYVWKDATKRLAVIGTIGSIPINGADYEFVELHLLKPEAINPLDLPGARAKQWAPDVTQLAPRPLPDGPPVAKNARARLAQMKLMARQFDAAMVEGRQTNQLRLLPQPLYRYDESTPSYDGGLFAFIWDKGTDPEVLLRLEVKEEDGQQKWYFQPVRFTWREVSLRHKESEVWRVEELIERDRPMQTTPYVTGLTQRIP